MFEKTKLMCREFEKDTRAAVDIGKIVTLVVTTMVGAIILGALIPTFSENLGALSKAAPSLSGLIDLLPMLVALIFVVAVVFVLLGMLSTKKM